MYPFHRFRFVATKELTQMQIHPVAYPAFP
jgi:hypothetical protein